MPWGHDGPLPTDGLITGGFSVSQAVNQLFTQVANQ